MVQRLREWLTLVLLTALPFHAFIVTVGTKLIAGPNQPPLAVLAFWKEAFLLVLLGLAFIEILRARKKPVFDGVDACIGILIALSLLIRTAPDMGGWTVMAYGFKYDLLPLVMFAILRRVPWSASFRARIWNVLLIVGVIIAIYGIKTLWLPDTFFRWLGYSDLHSLYDPGSSLAPYQQIGGTDIRRIQSVMSGPNQLGLWLLLPWTIAFIRMMKTWSLPAIGVWLLIDFALFQTYSRAAWIGAVVIAAILLLRAYPRAWRWTLPTALAAIVGLFLVRPDIVVRLASSRDHIIRPLQALNVMADHPLGLGLGTAGPASNRYSDVCVSLPVGSNADWAKPHPQLCVFIDGDQVQPTDRVCTCPLIPENWYLQIGIELGVIGLVVYLVMMLLVLSRLARCQSDKGQVTRDNKNPCPMSHVPCPIFLWLLGLSLAGLFLHSFEDAAVAYAVWALAAVALPVVARRGHA